MDLSILKEIVLNTFTSFSRYGYFQEALGYYCVDGGDVEGSVGPDVEAYLFKKLRKRDIWPIQEKINNYSEYDLFDIIELLYDLVSKPLKGYYHSYSNCGWHYDTFDREEGKLEFRNEINEVLEDYKEGYELSENGEILSKVTPGFEQLLKEGIFPFDPDNIDNKVVNAILKFRRHHSSIEEKRESVRALSDVLEFLRPKLKDILMTNDEKDLFNIANNFGIRHHNPRQKSDYDEPIWLNWIFYIYLATIDLSVRLLNRSEEYRKIK
ncbi:MAG TPA: hypothetical protein P5049_02675 [Methanothrix sp.]|nr:hypothetical protein [Methanothrix sp.]